MPRGNERSAGLFARSVRSAGRNPRLLARLREILETAEGEIASSSTHCRACGDCCDFTRAGHRLYITPIEAALLLQAGPVPEVRPLRCPYQQAGRCTARAVRPLGCRMYFCEEAGTSSREQVYEAAHGKVRELHQWAGIPYAYVEISAGMDEFVRI
jgi:Fe-S-cluster containining protein